VWFVQKRLLPHVISKTQVVLEITTHFNRFCPCLK
jgi:hypothetical protein